MPKFRVKGCFKENAEDVEIILEASSYKDAERIANQKGILVSNVLAFEEAAQKQHEPSVTLTVPPDSKKKSQTKSIVIASVIAIISIGLFNSILSTLKPKRGSSRQTTSVSSKELTRDETVSSSSTVLTNIDKPQSHSSQIIEPKSESKWSTFEQIDDFTDATVCGLVLPANKPFSGTISRETPQLLVICYERYLRIVFHFYTVIDGSALIRRFDNDGMEFSDFSKSNNFKSFSLGSLSKVEIKRKFLSDLENSERLRIQITPYGDATETIEFDLRGLNEAIEEMESLCGFNPHDILDDEQKIEDDSRLNDYRRRSGIGGGSGRGGKQ